MYLRTARGLRFLIDGKIRELCRFLPCKAAPVVLEFKVVDLL